MAQPADFYLQEYKKCFDDVEEFDKVHLITWNPKPIFYDYKPYGDNDYLMQWRSMVDLLCEGRRCLSRFCFVPEISDEGKLHMHGWYVVLDHKNYYKSFLPKLKRNGFVKKAKAKSHDFKTFVYHTKDFDATNDVLSYWSNFLVNHYNATLWRHEITHYKLMLKPSDLFDKPSRFKKDIMHMLLEADAFESSLEDSREF